MHISPNTAEVIGNNMSKKQTVVKPPADNRN